MAIFISDPSLALGLDISARKPVGSRADEGSDMKKAMKGSFYHIHVLGTRKHFRKLTNYNVIPITERDMIYSRTV
jgi:hypothetical protein